MKRFLVVAVTICAVAFVLLLIAVSNSPNSRTEPATNFTSNNAGDPVNGSTSTPSATEVSVYALYSAYHLNEVAADNQYKGKRLYLNAVVSQIRKDFTGTVVSELPVPFDEFNDVQASLNTDSENEAASLQPGSRVSIECDGAGMIIGSPMLDNCSFVQERKAAEVPNPPPSQPQIAQIPVAQEPAEQTSVSTHPQPDSVGTGVTVYTVGNGVSAPVVTYSPEAEFTDEARVAKFNGSVNVFCIVDANGNVQNPRVLNDPGMGLAANALAAIQKYRFKPAMLNGSPVPVRITVQVTFATY